MTDFSRPNAQWSDLPGVISALDAWHFEYSEADSIGTLSLASGLRRRMGAGLIVTGEEEVAGGTIVTWGITTEVNGEREAQVAYLHGKVYISG